MKGKKYFKVMPFCLMALVSIGMLTACSDDDDNGSVSSDVFHPINASTRTLRDVIEKNVYQPTEFGETIGRWPMLNIAGDGLGKLIRTSLKAVAATRLPQMDTLFKERVGTAEDGSRQWNIRRYVFTYKSISGATGNDTTLIGSVIFPTNTIGQPHQVDVLTLYHHQAYFADSWLPSHAVTMMAMHALHNSAVIETDAQGATIDIGEMIRGNVQGDLACLQMVDCVLAALEVMRQEGVTLAADGYTNSWGTSLGSFACIGFAQYMENDATPDLQQLIKLRASYFGEGATMPGQGAGFMDMVPDVPAQKYFDGWNPRLPFYVSLCPKDEFISYVKVKEYYAKLRTMPDGSINPHVQWLDLNMPSTVEKFISPIIGYHLPAAVISLMVASTVNNPSDMEKAFQSNNIFVE